MQKTRNTLFLVIMLFLGISTFAFGQSAATAVQDSLQMSVSPQTPNAGDSVTITLSSFSMNLDSSKVTWYVDGVAGQEGTGLTTLTIAAKAAGQMTTVKAVVETPDGATTDASVDIIPAGVDLVIEPTSYVPPFYKGKAIFTNQGSVRIVAIPNVIENGQKISSKNLIFDWQQDDAAMPSASGMGDDSITVDGSVPINDINIAVNVLDSSGNLVAQSSKVISADDPQVLVYENSPLYGILFNKAISGNYYLGQKNELDLIAKPYFFNLTSDSGSDSTYKWLVNGNFVEPSGRTNELILKQVNNNLAGTAAITLTANNNVRIFQYATDDFNVNFGI